MIEASTAIFGVNAVIVVRSGNVCIRATARNFTVRLAQARHSSDAKRTSRVDSGELGGRLHSCFLGNEAPSAIETHWRNPHIIPIVYSWLGGAASAISMVG